jgi:hypothetical protein
MTTRYDAGCTGEMSFSTSMSVPLLRKVTIEKSCPERLSITPICFTTSVDPWMLCEKFGVPSVVSISQEPTSWRAPFVNVPPIPLTRSCCPPPGSGSSESTALPIGWFTNPSKRTLSGSFALFDGTRTVVSQGASQPSWATPFRSSHCSHGSGPGSALTASPHCRPARARDGGAVAAAGISFDDVTVVASLASASTIPLGAPARTCRSCRRDEARTARARSLPRRTTDKVPIDAPP